MKNLGERISHVMKIKGLNPNKLSILAEVHASTIKNYRDNIGKPDHTKLDKIASILDISKEWLLNGTGEMEISNYINKKEVNNTVSENTADYYKGVPYYDIDFTASFLAIENNNQVTPDSYISHPFFKGCDYVVRASGQSMAKVICHGDAIGLIKINSWQEFFPFGEIYAIVTTDNFRMIKVITKGDTDEYYTLISKPTDGKKDEFPPQQIKKSSISAIFRVQASSHLF